MIEEDVEDLKKYYKEIQSTSAFLEGDIVTCKEGMEVYEHDFKPGMLAIVVSINPFKIGYVANIRDSYSDYYKYRQVSTFDAYRLEKVDEKELIKEERIASAKWDSVESHRVYDDDDDQTSNVQNYHESLDCRIDCRSRPFGACFTIA